MQKRIAAFALASAGVLSCVASLSTAASTAAPDTSLLDVVDEIIAQTMARDYRLDIETARSRTLEQDAFEELVPVLADHTDVEVWAGSWIDHEHDGALVVNLNDRMPGCRMTRSCPCRSGTTSASSESRTALRNSMQLA